MGNGYRVIGLFHKARTIRRWVVVIDGEEIPFHNRRLAFMGALAAKESGKTVSVLEETTVRNTFGMGNRHDDTFRIDLTYKLDMMEGNIIPKKEPNRAAE